MPVRLSLKPPTQVDDPHLLRLLSTIPEPDGVRGGFDAQAAPFDLEIATPRALDLRKLWHLTGKPVPADIEAAVGARTPVLLHHGLTAFNKPGANPRSIWGMGYRAELLGVQGATQDFVPQTRFLKVGGVDQELRVGLGFGGKLAAPDTVLEAVKEIPGVSLTGARIEGTTDQTFALSLRLELSLLEVEAGPVGAGGARWNFYRQAQKLNGFQPLLHTVLLPAGVTTLMFKVEGWVRSSGVFGGRLGGKEWRSEPVDLAVSLEGLEP